jgi:hemerythrin superfamily protein
LDDRADLVRATHHLGSLLMTDSPVEQDVVDVLTTDHREVLDLLQEIKVSTDSEQRRDFADTVISELVRHSVAEEMYVYPAMKKHLPDGAEAVEHDTREHKQLEKTMKELEGVPADQPDFDRLLAELEEILRDHIQDEEAEQFPGLRARVPREELVEIAEKVEAAKKIAPTRPHPLAPNNQVFHKLVGPGVGLVDRLRDKLSNRDA